QNLIRVVTETSTIPVIKHDKGVCHTFIDESAVKEMAENISVNAKASRPGVCNAMETLLVHQAYPYAKELFDRLVDAKIELRGCEKSRRIHGKIVPVSEEDWDTEYLDLILSVKMVSSMDAAAEHIYLHSSGHSEAIVTQDYSNAERFLRQVDSAAVFVNASTRFHDGGEFGLGAEVGISTQKLHARGAMGIEGLTCLKYIVYGDGQVRV
ncbi:MAG: glutamate-5-semialdehyde dehydrogenase, partial [Spirochaetota bacterium]